ncbi:MAG: aminotransferase class V-fold PLP-dependent enzyme [Gammaproteobacteria bacterium]|nr:aminotransferase class V-fold PLP-dependent enzyme [Gammaproteobacteria bacterium]MDH4314870.1 aminotransferase class V-fold PLP-dependent enzyme [Gammaproteobacteria bacterium]MDH5213782.1 aminotransferase class V-fold PLP-dependent enzyme [Gammaproteobacteria bacterium]MDH5499847.1 aminotransferase class V-fold PLP-dependent enzyme [Gammaproteobacteria bacterium]
MNIQRREFLQIVGGAVLAGSAGLQPASAKSSAIGWPSFGFPDDKVPMNAANICPMPVIVSEAYARYARELDDDLSPGNRQRIEALRESARSRIAGLLGTSSDELALVRNTSEANNVIVQGLPLSQEDEVLLWDQNHPSNSVAWDVRASRSGCKVRRFSIPTETGSVDEVISRVVDEIGNNTRVISFTHISNISGFRLPLAELCAAIRRRKENVHIHVDGAQTWGAVDVKLGVLECDSFTGSAHKWFTGPREVGLLYVRKQHIRQIWPSVVSVPWGSDVEPSAVGARKFDALGQRDDAALAALDDAASLHESMTPAGVEQRSMAIANRLRDGLQDLGVPFVSSTNAAFTSSVIILSTRPAMGDELVDRVFKDSGIITAMVGGFRMSPHFYNTEDHVDRVVAAVGRNRNMLA